MSTYIHTARILTAWKDTVHEERRKTNERQLLFTSEDAI